MKYKKGDIVEDIADPSMYKYGIVTKIINKYEIYACWYKSLLDFKKS